MRFRFTLPTALLALTLGACGLVYEVPVNQGNLLEQESIDAIEPGMTKRQVALIMGTPSVQSPFDVDTWSYTASLPRRGKKPQVKSFVLIFENDVLARIEGDYFPQREEQLLEESRKIRGRQGDILEEAEQDREREKQERGGG